MAAARSRGLVTACLAIALSAGWLPSVEARQAARAQVLTPKLVAARRAELQRTLDTYAAGDRDVMARQVQLDAVTRVALVELIRDSTTDWHVRAAFAMETIVVLHRGREPTSLQGILRAGRDLVMRRLTAIGANAADDRFEVLWHHMALAVIEGMPTGISVQTTNSVSSLSSSWSHDYLATVNPRLIKLAQTRPPIPNRFALMRAIDAAMDCCGQLTTPLPDQSFVVVRTRSGQRLPTPRMPIVSDPAEALALFEAAATDPALRVEALIRAAYLDERFGRVPSGLDRLDRASPVADPVLRYASALIRACLLDRQGPPDSAATAYDAALQLAPGAQIPAIGRAAALQRAGRIDEAIAAADRARRIPTDGIDPWPDFIRADARFLDGWLLDLRVMLK